jgi:hypothetical protein
VVCAAVRLEQSGRSANSQKKTRNNPFEKMFSLSCCSVVSIKVRSPAFYSLTDFPLCEENNF